jgi:hypothetical protein
MYKIPFVTVEVTFLPAAEGGRVQTPDLTSGRYMPHLVVQSPGVRYSILGDNHTTEHYLGVAFLQGPPEYVAGQPARSGLALIYWPNVDYDALQPGATFTVREGPSIVGYGAILERTDPGE